MVSSLTLPFCERTEMRERGYLQLDGSNFGACISASVHAYAVQYCGIRVWAVTTGRQVIPSRPGIKDVLVPCLDLKAKGLILLTSRLGATHRLVARGSKATQQ